MVSKAIHNPRLTLEKIFCAAEREFQEHGYEDARISRIAAYASTSKQIIYNYFINKENLYLYVIDQLTIKHRENLHETNFRSNDPISDLKAYILRIYDMFSNHNGRLESTVLVNASGPSRVTRFLKGSEKTFEILEDILRRGVAKKVFISGVSPVDFYIFILASTSALNASRDAYNKIRAFHLSTIYSVEMQRSYATSLIVSSILTRRPEASFGEESSDFEGRVEHLPRAAGRASRR